MAEGIEALKSLLMKGKEESESLKLSIRKTKIMGSSPIISWQTDGETMETVSDFIFLGSNINVDSDCSHEIKRRLFLGRKAMTNLDSESVLLNCGLGKTLDGPWDSKEIQPVHPKGSQSWTFIIRTDAKAPILWSPDAKNWLTGKDPDAGKDWREEEKGQ